MAGHSRWKNIKHRKAISDAKRGKAWSKCVRAIMVAARNGGPDPESNLTLRYALDDARYENVPRDTVERAVKKGSGELVGEQYEHVRYEGYGPGGVALIVDALTNNRTRTAGDLRLIFGDHGGNLGTTGCVGFLFEHRGAITVTLLKPADEDRLLEIATEAGAADLVNAPEKSDGAYKAMIVYTAPVEFHAIRAILDAAKFDITDARLLMQPTTTVVLRGEHAKTMLEMMDALDDNDDVQKTFANFDIPESELSVIQGE